MKAAAWMKREEGCLTGRGEVEGRMDGREGEE